MGTNFYLRHIPTEKEYNEMQRALIKRQYNELHCLLDKYSYSYHIGKRSGGWQFLFAPHNDEDGYDKNPWENTLESLKKCLSDPEYEIVDEYNRIYTPEQFWEEIGDCLYNDPERYINEKQYYQRHPEELYSTHRKWEFTTDEGLRFSTTIDFS